MTAHVVIEPFTRWLRANDIDPKQVPVDAEIHVDPVDQTITFERHLTDEQGRIVVRGNTIVMTVATVPLKVAPEPGLLTALRRHNLEQRIRRDATHAGLLTAARQQIRELRDEVARVTGQGEIQLARLREDNRRLSDHYTRLIADKLVLLRREAAIADATADHTRLCRLRSRITAILDEPLPPKPPVQRAARDFRQEVADWLRANDVDPANIPYDAAIEWDYTAGTITFEQWLVDEQGHRAEQSPGRPMRITVTAPLKVEPGAWLSMALSAYAATRGGQ